MSYRQDVELLKMKMLFNATWRENWSECVVLIKVLAKWAKDSFEWESYSEVMTNIKQSAFCLDSVNFHPALLLLMSTKTGRQMWERSTALEAQHAPQTAAQGHTLAPMVTFGIVI